MEKLKAQEDLRRIRVAWITSPSYSQAEVDKKTAAIRELEELAYPPSSKIAPPKSLPFRETLAMGALLGLVEVTQGPPVAHGIGTRKAGFRSDEQQ